MTIGSVNTLPALNFSTNRQVGLILGPPVNPSGCWLCGEMDEGIMCVMIRDYRFPENDRTFEVCGSCLDEHVDFFKNFNAGGVA